MSPEPMLSATLRRRRNAGTIAAVAAAVLMLGILDAAASAQSAPAAPRQGAGDPRVVTASRVAGEDRIGTAVAISQRAFPDGASAVYLARSDDPADAVAGGSLTDGPVLLVGSCALPEVVAAEIRRLQPTEVVALGGSAAVCDAVLDDALVAASTTPDDGTGGDQGDATVTATAEVVDVDTASGEAPFTVDVADIGVVFEGGEFPHDVTITSTDGTLTFNDPRFTGAMTDGDGRMVVAGPGCAPNGTDAQGQVEIACTEELRFVTATPEEPAVVTTTLHTDDAEVGDAPLAPGTYVLHQPVSWEADDHESPAFDDGSATIRITYTVSAPGGGSDTPTESPEDVQARQAVVTWETPEGSFSTNGHGAADLARIREGAATRTSIGIPNGVIHRGDGGINVGHEWHLTDIEVVDMTMEVCDGTAQYVDDHLEDFLAIGRYCPWGAVPVEVVG